MAAQKSPAFTAKAIALFVPLAMLPLAACSDDARKCLETKSCEGHKRPPRLY